MAKENAKDMAIGFIGGINGGIVTVYIGQPLDTIKVKMQTFPERYSNAFRCFIDTFRKDGLYRGLYSGTVPALTANIAENSVLFCAYAPSQKLVAWLSGKPSVQSLAPFENACAGSMAAFWCSLVLCPTELVKCRLQSLTEMVETGQLKIDRKSIGPWKICKEIVREDGMKGFFRGLVPTFYREIPGYFFFFGGYEAGRALFTPPGGSKEDIGPFKTAICGGIGGVSLWTAIFPMDVVKSRTQISHDKSSGVISVLKEIYATQGFRALYKGLGPTIARTFPATGGLFVSYEYTKKILYKLTDE